MNEKCGYYSDGECNICGMGMSGEDTFCRLCKDNPNCYYKQLDKLKAKKDKYYQQTLDDEIKMNELYEENELLRETIKTWQYSDGQHMLKINKLEQKLEDILDFCISIRNEFCESNCSRKFACEKRSCYLIKDFTHIINIIKERIDE